MKIVLGPDLVLEQSGSNVRLFINSGEGPGSRVLLGPMDLLKLSAAAKALHTITATYRAAEASIERRRLRQDLRDRR
jgi:hypothetical protein